MCNTLLILQNWVNLCCLGNIPPWTSGYHSESSVAPPTTRTSMPQGERHPTRAGEKEEGRGRNQEVVINSVIDMHWDRSMHGKQNYTICVRYYRNNHSPQSFQHFLMDGVIYNDARTVAVISPILSPPPFFLSSCHGRSKVYRNTSILH